jgi:tetratricopeptide (TPR) repeat protein
MRQLLTGFQKSIVVLVLCATVATSTMPSISVAAPAANPQAFQQGLSAYQAGRLDEAVGLFQQALQANPKNADAYYNLGAVYYKQKKYTEALSTFNKLLQIAPTDQSARYHVGNIYEKLGKPTEAIKSYEQIKPDSTRYQVAQDKLKTLKAIAASKPAAQAATIPAKPATPAVTPPTPNAETFQEFATGFSGPTGIAQDTNGFLIVANYSKHCIDKVNQQGEHTSLVCNGGISGPVGVVVDRVTGLIYVANHIGNTVARITPDGKVTIISKNLSQPYNLYLDEQHRQLYVTQQKTNSIARIKL